MEMKGHWLYCRYVIVESCKIFLKSVFDVILCDTFLILDQNIDYMYRLEPLQCFNEYKNLKLNKSKKNKSFTRLKIDIYLRSPYLIIISAICHCHPFKNELVLVLNTAWRKQPIADYVSNHNRTCGESVSENSE